MLAWFDAGYFTSRLSQVFFGITPVPEEDVHVGDE
jgi:hypothetical protein